MAAVFFMVTMALYFAATVSYLALLLRRADALSTVSLTITSIGFATHTIALVARMVGATGAVPPSIHEALSFFLPLNFVTGFTSWARLSSRSRWFPSCPLLPCLRQCQRSSPCFGPCGFTSHSAC